MVTESDGVQVGPFEHAAAVSLEQHEQWDNQAGTNLVLCLTGATGIDFTAITAAIEAAFAPYGYDVLRIKLSNLLNEYSKRLLGRPARSHHHDERVWDLMSVGNLVRKETQNRGVAVEAIASMWQYRIDTVGRETSPTSKTVFVVDSLKHKAEIELLRQVYGDTCLVVAAWASEEARLREIASRIAASNDSHVTSASPSDRAMPLPERGFWNRARIIQHRDENEAAFSRSLKHHPDSLEAFRSADDKWTQLPIDWLGGTDGKNGQDVRGCFALADFFVNTENQAALRETIARFARLLMGHQFETPTPLEMGMAIADVARYQSSDSGRQVGAAIWNAKGAILGVGTNEVPRPGGGQYWPRSIGVSGGEDYRDLAYRPSLVRRQQERALVEIVQALVDQGLLDAKPFHAMDGDDAGSQGDKAQDLRHLASGDPDDDEQRTEILNRFKLVVEAFEGSRVDNLIEFFRTTHAELAAIMSALDNGGHIVGASLCSTTFPCHECTRHIIHSGIEKVYFIEPYEKSLGLALHPDALCMKCSPLIVEQRPECRDPPCAKVHLWPFTGVGPRQYARLFKPGKRRDNRTKEPQTWRHGSPKLLSSISWINIYISEQRAAREFGKSTFTQPTLASFAANTKPSPKEQEEE